MFFLIFFLFFLINNFKSSEYFKENFTNYSIENSIKNNEFYEILTTKYSIFYKLDSNSILKKIERYFLSKEIILHVLKRIEKSGFHLTSHEEKNFLKNFIESLEKSINSMNFYHSDLFEKLTDYEKLSSLKEGFNYSFFEEDRVFLSKKINEIMIKLNSLNKDSIIEKIAFPKIVSVKKFLQQIINFYNGNNLLEKKTGNIKKSLIWYFYAMASLDFKKSIFTDEQSNFILLLPLHLEKINKDFSNIQFLTCIESIFDTKTSIGKLSIYKETLPLFTNSEMAKEIIDKRILFIKLINENEELKNGLEKIINDFSELIIKVKSNENLSFLSGYLRSHIPPEILGTGGLDSSNFYFNIWSMYKQWTGPLSIFMQYVEFTRKNRINNSIIGSTLFDKITNNGFLRSIPLFQFHPTKTTILGKDDPYTFFDFYNNETKAYSSKDGLIAPSLIDKITIIPIAASSKWSYSIFFKIIALYQTIDSINNIYKSTKAMSAYFKYLKDIINLSKKACNLISDFYTNNNIPLEFMIPEIYNGKKEIGNNNLLNILAGWNSGFKGKIKAIVDIALPGNISKLYFKKIQSNYDIFENLGLILGSIDASLSKSNLLNSENKNFCTPKILKNNESELKLEGMWYPATNNPVENNIDLYGDHRNIFIVSPVSGGKSTTLGSIINTLYLSNCGLTTAKNAEFTYYDYIMPFLKHESTLGSGISGHLSEYQDFERVQFLMEVNQEINKIEDRKKIIIFFDEVFNTSNHNDIYDLAEINLSEILLKKNTNCIITTHNENLLKLKDNKNFNLKTYYIEILYDQITKKFTKTFKLKPDDKNNWWFQNDKKQWRLEFYKYAYKNILPPMINENKSSHFDGNFSFSDFFII